MGWSKRGGEQGGEAEKMPKVSKVLKMPKVSKVSKVSEVSEVSEMSKIWVDGQKGLVRLWKDWVDGRPISRVVGDSRGQGIVGPDGQRAVVRILLEKGKVGGVGNEKHKTIEDHHSYEDDKVSIVFLLIEEKKRSFGEGLEELGGVLLRKALLRMAAVVRKKQPRLCEEGTDRAKVALWVWEGKAAWFRGCLRKGKAVLFHGYLGRQRERKSERDRVLRRNCLGGASVGCGYFGRSFRDGVMRFGVVACCRWKGGCGVCFESEVGGRGWGLWRGGQRQVEYVV